MPKSSLATLRHRNRARLDSRLAVTIQNPSTESTLNVYVTGRDAEAPGRYFFLKSDGWTSYYPNNPDGPSTSRVVDCTIRIAPESSTTTMVPYLVGGRIWFCLDDTLTFQLRRSESSSFPAVVEPSISNSEDPNYSLNWGFCELSYSATELYANISYVDFVGLPVSLTATSSNGDPAQYVSGIPVDGLTKISRGLIEQSQADGAEWDKLVVENNDEVLRVVSPSNGIALDASLFQNYWNRYIEEIWAQYATRDLIVDTQSSTGIVAGYTSNDQIHFEGVGAFSKPSALDIFGANTGPFKSSNSEAMKNIGARINAAINRTTLHLFQIQPWGNGPEFYQEPVTNHYARLLHCTNTDGKGYAFPYDDVMSTGGGDTSGFVRQSSPKGLLVVVGGLAKLPKNRKRKVLWASDIKIAPDEMEKGWEAGAPRQYFRPENHYLESFKNFLRLSINVSTRKDSKNLI